MVNVHTIFRAPTRYDVTDARTGHRDRGSVIVHEVCESERDRRKYVISLLAGNGARVDTVDLGWTPYMDLSDADRARGIARDLVRAR